MTDKIVTKIRKRLPNQCRCARHLWCCKGRTARTPIRWSVVWIILTRHDHIARCNQAIAHRETTGIRVIRQARIRENFRRRHVRARGIAGDVVGAARCKRTDCQPADLKICGRLGAIRSWLRRHRRHVRRVRTPFVTGCKNDKPTILDNELTVFRGDGRRCIEVGPVQATPGVVHDFDAAGDEVVVDRLETERAADFVALPRAVIGRTRVVDDARRNNIRSGCHAARPRAPRQACHAVRDGGTVSDNVVLRQIVTSGADVGQVRHDARIQRWVIADNTGVNDTNGHARAGEAGGLTRSRIRHVIRNGKIRADSADDGRLRTAGRWWIHRWRCCRCNDVAAPTATTARSQTDRDGQRKCGIRKNPNLARHFLPPRENFMRGPIHVPHLSFVMHITVRFN